MNDTIFALATAPGRAAVAVLRLSGPGAGRALEQLAGRKGRPRQAALRRLRAPGDAVLDEALTLWFPGPHSFTGEDCVELQLHGGAAVVDAVTAALQQLGLRLAEPGEFTRRAFENGRLDLTQAEAVADLVDAETDAQRRQALQQLDGALARRHLAWREALIEALAVLEAAVDFPDEDLPEAVAEAAGPALFHVKQELGEALADAVRGERVREGYRIALLGAPNAGKSSLLNALAGRDAAIVTDTPGTTRDVIEIPLTLAGYRVLLADAAGVRETHDPIESEGVRRARAWAESADLRLLLVDGSAGDDAWRDAAALCGPADLCLINKADLPIGVSAAAARNWAESAGLATWDISVRGGAGLDCLKADLERRTIEALSGADFPAATRARHRHDLEAARASIDQALEALNAGLSVELAAEDVRLAARSLERISGRIGAEDVLDQVFARFCIGK